MKIKKETTLIEALSEIKMLISQIEEKKESRNRRS